MGFLGEWGGQIMALNCAVGTSLTERLRCEKRLGRRWCFWQRKGLNKIRGRSLHTIFVQKEGCQCGWSQGTWYKEVSDTKMTFETWSRLLLSLEENFKGFSLALSKIKSSGFLTLFVSVLWYLLYCSFIHILTHLPYTFVSDWKTAKKGELESVNLNKRKL